MNELEQLEVRALLNIIETSTVSCRTSHRYRTFRVLPSDPIWPNGSHICFSLLDIWRLLWFISGKRCKIHAYRTLLLIVGGTLYMGLVWQPAHYPLGHDLQLSEQGQAFSVTGSITRKTAQDKYKYYIVAMKHKNPCKKRQSSCSLGCLNSFIKPTSIDTSI